MLIIVLNTLMKIVDLELILGKPRWISFIQQRIAKSLIDMSPLVCPKCSNFHYPGRVINIFLESTRVPGYSEIISDVLTANQFSYIPFTVNCKQHINSILTFKF
jgi:hypothetical protein